MIKTTVLSFIGMGALALMLISPAQAGDGVPITSISTTRSAAIPSGPYTIGGNTIRYGVGTNVRLDSASLGGINLQRSSISKPSIKINRINNANVSGDRLTFFYPGMFSGSNVNIEGNEAPSMEIAMNDDYLTSGGLDVFLNVDNGVERANNIERVDFVVRNGMTLPSTTALLAEIGTIANEKHGNNTYKIAMITALDGFDEPSAYGPLKSVQGNVDYGNVGRPKNAGGTDLRNLYMRNGAAPVGADNGPVGYVRSDTNFIGLSFLSFAALGATPNQVVYGFSLFPNDMFDSNDLVGLSDAPLNTSGSINGGDIYGGTFAIFSTAAAEAESSENLPEISASKTVEIYDPLNQGLYALPGNDVVYTITISNSGSGSPDPDSMFLVDTLPADSIFFNGDADGPGPGTDPVILADYGSGMTLSYADDVGFALAGSTPTEFSDCDYDPISNYDALVRYVCFLPSGTMVGSAAVPSFDLTFRTQIR